MNPEPLPWLPLTLIMTTLGRTRAATPATDEAGRYRIVTLRPGPLPCPDGGFEAPHLDVSVFARGLLDRVVTRIYFADEAANETDPVLSGITDSQRRATLIATAEPGGPAGAFRFDIRLQGGRETVFFDV